MNRYQQSPRSNSLFFVNSKKLNSKTKLSPATSASFVKNPEIDQVRLPSLSSRSSMKKSFSTFQSERNTKFKLVNLQDKLEQFSQLVHATRRQAQESLQNVKFLKQKLIKKQLVALQNDLKYQLSGLHKLVQLTKNQQQNRSKQIRQDCDKMWNMTQSLKQCMFQLRMKVDKLDSSMGYKNI